MTSPLTSARFAIVPIISDSRGNEVVPANAIMVGSQSAVMEHVLDSNARNDAVTLVKDAAKALGTLETIQEREQSVAEREDSVRHSLMQDFIGQLDALAQRIDSLEVEQEEQAKLAAYDPDDDHLPSPPVSVATGDDGDLQSPTAAPSETGPDLPIGDDGELASPIPVPNIEKFQAGPRSPVAAEDA